MRSCARRSCPAPSSPPPRSAAAGCARPAAPWPPPPRGSGWPRGAGASAVGRVGRRGGGALAAVAAGTASLGDAGARTAFVHPAGAAIDPGGQRVSATDRLYLAAEMPTLVVWGERDPIIPVEHGRAAHAAMPGSRLEVFPGAGHFPHREDPARFVALLEGFIGSTEPAVVREARWRELLLTAR